jgi:hypothetical protein
MVFYTNIHSLTDGFGETLRFVFMSILYAEYMGGIFHYTPFKDTMEHNYEKDPSFLPKKEDLVRLNQLFPIANPIITSYEPIGKFNLLHFFEVMTEWVVTNSFYYKQVKKVFFEGRSRSIENKYAAIHIRRMNQLDKERQPKLIEGCDVPDSIYDEIIQLIRIQFPDYEIHIFSQGEKEDFDISHSDKLHWHLNESIESTFLEMAFADILVIAPSAFSYCAGLYSNSKEIWYIESCLKPLPHWKPIVGYTSTRNAYQFYLKTQKGRIELTFDPKENRFYESDGKEFVFE